MPSIMKGRPPGVGPRWLGLSRESTNVARPLTVGERGRDKMVAMRLIPPVVPAGRMADREQPVIRHDDGPLLRPWCADDVDVVLEAFADPDVQRWHFRRLDDVDAAEEWIAATNEGWETERSAAWAVIG